MKEADEMLFGAPSEAAIAEAELTSEMLAI